jgi:nicotinate dehydrogenase subunit B
MLHARMVHPKTLGSTLISAGELDKTKFPNAQVVVKGNLVGVVAPTEWEAIRPRSRWPMRHEVDGLERDCPATPKLFTYLSERGRLEIHAGHEERQEATGRVARAGGGPQEAFRDVSNFLHEARAHRADHGRGRCSCRRHGAHLYAQPESPGAARRNRADAGHLRSITSSCMHVSRPGHYGRSNGGNAGAEDEAVILSQARRQAGPRAVDAADDFQWSTQSPAAYSDVEPASTPKAR